MLTQHGFRPLNGESVVGMYINMAFTGPTLKLNHEYNSCITYAEFSFSSVSLQSLASGYLQLDIDVTCFQQMIHI